MVSRAGDLNCSPFIKFQFIFLFFNQMYGYGYRYPLVKENCSNYWTLAEMFSRLLNEITYDFA